MTDVKVKEMIARIREAGNTLTSNLLQTVIAKSHEDGRDRKGERGRRGENEAEGVEQGGADKGDSEGEGAVQQDENDYLLADPRPSTAGPVTGSSGRGATRPATTRPLTAGPVTGARGRGATRPATLRPSTGGPATNARRGARRGWRLQDPQQRGR